jgi:hypothetical protein
MSETYKLRDKRKCPICGCEVVLNHCGIMPQVHIENYDRQIILGWRCAGCGAEFQADGNIIDGAPVVSNRKIELTEKNTFMIRGNLR